MSKREFEGDPDGPNKRLCAISQDQKDDPSLLDVVGHDIFSAIMFFAITENFSNALRIANVCKTWNAWVDSKEKKIVIAFFDSAYGRNYLQWLILYSFLTENQDWIAIAEVGNHVHYCPIHWKISVADDHINHGFVIGSSIKNISIRKHPQEVQRSDFERNIPRIASQLVFSNIIVGSINRVSIDNDATLRLCNLLKIVGNIKTEKQYEEIVEPLMKKYGHKIKNVWGRKIGIYRPYE